MKLDKYKEEIYKCSGCGQCLNPCPVYNILKSESSVSRGKFNLLNAVVNRDIKFSKKIEKIMDLCLHCAACNEFCPANIDILKIINSAKFDMFTNNICSLKKRGILLFFENKFLMKTLKILLDFYRNRNLLKWVDFFNNKYFHIKCVKLINDYLRIRVPKSYIRSTKTSKLKVLYFKGCTNTYINPSCFHAGEKILIKLNVEIKDAEFLCCGLPSKNIGNLNKYVEIAKKNIDLISDDVDYILVDCASCLETLKNYKNDLDGIYREKAQKISEKIISVYELLEMLNYTMTDKNKNHSVVFHNPCVNRFNNENEIIKNLLQKNKIEPLSLSEKSGCCGASFPFVILNNDLSKKISEKKAEDIISTNANIVLTTCPLCEFGLRQGLLLKNANVEVMQLLEYLL